MKLTHSLPSRHAGRRQRGFSLLEIMVGVAIGLIGIVVIFQVLEVWEGRKRTTSSGSDAQIAGTIAMFNLERDVRLAGYGFGNAIYMGCTVNAYDSTRATPAFTFGLYPVQIIDGAAGAPDQIVVLYGNSPFFTSNQSFTASTATTKKAANNASFQPGELVIVAGNSPADCAMVEVTSNAVASTVTHDTGTYTNYLLQANTTPRYNSAAGTGTTFSSGVLYNLGLAPRLDTWQIRSNNALAWNESMQASTTWSDVAEGIVNMQAQYGVDANNDNMIASSEWTITTPADWTKVRAIRVALLARSQQFEKTAITPVAPSWSGGSFVMTDLDGSSASGSNTANDWRHYRYRVYERVIPLRNMIWGTLP